MRAGIVALAVALGGAVGLGGAVAEPAAAGVPVAPVSYDREDNCAIPDNDPAGVLCTIEVPDVGTLVDVDVGVRIAHTFAADLDLFLVGPDATTVELSTDNGSGDDDYGTGPDPCDGTTVYTTFDDAAPTSIFNGTVPFAGVFGPEGSLAAFNGKSRAGTWTLRVVDDNDVDVGEVLCWRLTTTTGDTDDDGLTDDEELAVGGDPSDPCSPASCQPDGLIKRPKHLVFTGDDVFGADGSGQKEKKRVKRGRKARFDLRFENGPSGVPEDLMIIDEGTKNAFKVKYFDDGTEVTDALRGAGYVLADPGGDLRLAIRVKKRANPDAKFVLRVTAASTIDPALVDTVKAVTKVK